MTIIQRDSLRGKLSTVSGASKRSVKAGEEIITSFKIGDINFIDTHARSTDMEGLKEQIPNFGGLIGQSIMSKANWLINYPDKTIRFSNKNLADNKTSGELLEPIKETITKNSETKITFLFSKLISKRNRIVHSFQITEKNEQILRTKNRKHEQYNISEEYLLDFIRDNEGLSSMLDKFRGIKT